MIHLLDPKRCDLEGWLAQHNHPRYRADQIHRWLYSNRAESLDEMTDLPTELRDELGREFQLWTTSLVRHTRSDDGTEKLLLELQDGGRVECVLLRDGTRRSVCISSQVGCGMGCVFCASGLDGVDRNLSAGEMIEQMLYLQRLLPNEERLSHIVMMGMGEPLANLDNVLAALDEASREDGLGISVRRITISTVGLPEAIDRMVKLGPKYQLAVSLHATDDHLRSQIVPTNPKTGLDRILAAADRYFEASGRRLTFEYVLLADINDQVEHAHRLAELLHGRTALLNVIPYNPVEGLPYHTPAVDVQQRFRHILEDAGITVKFRQRKGDKIAAACGQLRRVTQHAIDP